MKTKKPMVLIKARNLSNLNLTEFGDSMLANCGVIGKRDITKAVLDGGGQTQIEMSILKSAIIHENNVNIIQDNFELFDPESNQPLLLHLISEYLKNNKA